MSDDNFLARWSRRKLASTAAPDRPSADAIPVEPAPVIIKPGTGIPSTASAAPVAPTQAGARASEEPEPLQPIESLTPESDFKPFMNAKVDPETKRQALKALFTDPRFNVMDGLDVYIDDYSKADPLPAGWLEKMNQFAYLGDRGERDREEAARVKALDQAPPPVPHAGNIEQEQPLAATPEPAPSHTSDAVSPPSGLQESEGKPPV